MRFSVMWKDEKTADVFVSDDHKTVEIKKYSDVIYKMPFGGNNDTIERVYNFISERWIPAARPDMKDRLHDLGLTEYNPWEIIKKTHGVMWEDFIWIKFEGEDITWEEARNA